MEKEDLKIKQFLEQMATESAPEGFTNRVMEMVNQTESLPVRKESGDWMFGLITALAAAIGFLTYFLFDPTFAKRFFGSVYSFMLTAVQSTKGLLQEALPANTFMFSTFWIGLVAAITLLLVLEKLLRRRQLHTGLFFTL